MSLLTQRPFLTVFAALLVGLLLGVGLAYFGGPSAADSAGYHFSLEPKRGEPTEILARFGGDTPARLANIEGKPKNLILLIGDGMGFSQITAGRMATVGSDGRLMMERLPVTGWSLTHSKARTYTDSASGASALATGVKTAPGRISTDVDGNPQTTLFEKAQAAGYSVGTVTDSMALDATPAAFLVQSPKRKDYLALARSALEMKPDVMIGGLPRPPGQSETWDSLWDGYEEAGYRRLGPDLDAETFAPVDDARPVLGLFRRGALADDGGSGLFDAATFALDRLKTDEDGFMLMVETEETDSGGHNLDFERLVRGVASLDRVTELAVELAQARRDTLIIVTADHETGGLALLRGYEGKPLTVRFATDNHSAEPVPVLAYGPGSEHFMGVLDNAEIGRILSDLFFPRPQATDPVQNEDAAQDEETPGDGTPKPEAP